MDNRVNRNYIWSQQFVQKLAELGVKYVCISPGSRNTPLNLAFHNEERIKTFVNIDERSSGFFALGLAMESDSPVAVVTTSGTAVAELYPAIIEAYQQKVPLIICTADRPPELKNCGANQTIDQNNIFANHINWFYDLGLPELNEVRLNHLRSIAEKAFISSFLANRGPVHLNFPFSKPLEPDSFTDTIQQKIISGSQRFNDLSDLKEEHIPYRQISNLAGNIINISEGIIICGSGDYRNSKADIINLSLKLGYPIFSDAASSLKFGNQATENIIINHTAFLRSNKFRDSNHPKIIIHFGSAPTSKVMLDYFKHAEADKYLVNKYDEWKDPSNTAKEIIKAGDKEFCKELIKQISCLPPGKERKNDWLNLFISADIKSKKIIYRFLTRAKFPFEGSIYNYVLDAVPGNSNIMVSNSSPIRDLDSFSDRFKKNINVFSNRGASGIDGIISTAIGISAQSKTKTFLITGDLAFYHDLNGLLASSIHNIDLTIILINNNGGGLFEMLPISSSNKKAFEKYFTTPHNLDFKPIVKGYKGKYKLIKSWDELTKELRRKSNLRNLTVLEIQTDSHKSKSQRLKCRANVVKEIDNTL
ncbi:MAG: 2-succinyl-5-enolpyruvyl-6-hydroxy-3-cyclohexene-1-carboxylic-acid synthase [Melioribacteraceae bacterium]|nr:2-succinyl-5-enolpyruvyl-6-hydroxy-3-cyclohexene-1-carboxylic-acid synthase [Melioribacteraceae bacterium]